MSDEWMGQVYTVVFWIVWVITFLAVWIICSDGYGFLGFALGWMPAIIVAYIVAFLWPLLVIAAFVIYKEMK